ncbi:UPF0481 protein At3g47200-like isoform X2 [Salvia miltiorrhiza]|uniref:UPF0481 protein At3g47200-like isoform X2 n=1 Tax=Salvia miltiorrhiza TaxID=226208 RepID=UPI0025AC232A|nr:UPF0481 protein At3g47200-like isoform X2 [Salvia miltiorrhiza]
MAEESGKDELSVNIDEMLHEFSYTASRPSTPFIYRVTDSLRSTKETEYDPIIISIGPLHHGKHNLQAMEPLKMWYLKKLLGDSSVDSYVQAIRSNEQTARDFYAEKIELNTDELVKMLLLDAIFIIQFLREYDKELGVQESKGDPIFGFEHVKSHILRDLMLFENQIPMFIVRDLFQLSNHDNQEFKYLFWPLFQHRRDVPTVLPEAHHLLGLVHAVKFCSSVQQLLRRIDKPIEMENILSATELRAAGILFKKNPENENGKDPSLLDITFKNKTFCIAKLEMTDEMESWLRNMIAYEFYLPRNKPKCISDYAFFLKCLMCSSEDAELLRHYGVISNCLGGDARVYEVIDRLMTNVFTSKKFLYLGVFDSINNYSKRKRNRWFAVLRRHHFNNPWTVISVVAAAVLLSVGIVQMVIAILSFYHN